MRNWLWTVGGDIFKKNQADATPKKEPEIQKQAEPKDNKPKAKKVSTSKKGKEKPSSPSKIPVKDSTKTAPSKKAF